MAIACLYYNDLIVAIDVLTCFPFVIPCSRVLPNPRPRLSPFEISDVSLLGDINMGPVHMPSALSFELIARCSVCRSP